MTLSHRFALGLGLCLGAQAVEAGGSQMPISELVDVATYVHDLIVKKPYVTDQNFTGEVVYPASDKELVGVCKLEEGAAQKIKIADEKLKASHPEWRFLAWDCYRPPKAQEMLWTAYGCDSNRVKCAGYIAPPGRSKHNKGLAIDITLADQKGTPLPMPTHYDDFSTRAHVGSYSGWSIEAQKNWTAMNTALTGAGCTVNPSEWWHYDC